MADVKVYTNGQVHEIQMPNQKLMIHMPSSETEKKKVSEMAVPSNLKLDWHDLRIHTFAKNTLWLYLNDDVSLRFAKVEV